MDASARVPNASSASRALSTSRVSSAGRVSRAICSLVVTALVIAGCSPSGQSVGTTIPGTSTPGSGTASPTPPSDAGIALTDVALTPPGWVPVFYGDAQLSVPRTWSVVSNAACLTEGRTPTLFLGGGGGFCVTSGQQGGAEAVEMNLIAPALEPSEPPVRRFERVNGLEIDKQPGQSYLVPALGVRISFLTRHLDVRLLDTLTRSPRAVALAPGAAEVAPHGWRQLTVGRVGFAVPPGWRIERTEAVSIGSPCRDVLEAPAHVVLSTGRLYPAYPCHALEIREPIPSVLGLEVNAPTGVAPRFGVTDCRDQARLRICAQSLTELTAPSPLLELAITPASDQSAHPTVAVIGLAGSGLIDRQVLDSFRAVGRHR